MTTPENPHDQTIWDPIDPEQAIEDQMHGSEAVAGLLSIPPMRQEDGSYWVFGGYYACGTNTFDAEGRPFIKLGKPTQSMMALQREMLAHKEWVEAYHAGELPPLEEMDLPAFLFDEPAYIVMDGQDEFADRIQQGKPILPLDLIMIYPENPIRRLTLGNDDGAVDHKLEAVDPDEIKEYEIKPGLRLHSIVDQINQYVDPLQPVLPHDFKINPKIVKSDVTTEEIQDALEKYEGIKDSDDNT